MESLSNGGQYYKFAPLATKVAGNANKEGTAGKRHSASTVTSPHSGHFMTSNLEDDDDYVDGLGRGLGVEGPDPTDAVSALTHGNHPKTGYNFEEACKTPRDTYRFTSGGNKNYFKDFDNSLSKLFACMSLAYSGKLTTPKFKAFKGLKINVWDKMRLNNIIWREWHLQFVQKHKPAVCSFTIQMDDTHSKPQAVVLEGKYWKRKLEIVCVEYQKWRVFYKKKIMPRSQEPMGGSSEKETEEQIQELLERVADTSNLNLSHSTNLHQPANHASDTVDVQSDYPMDFSDAFFSTFSPITQPPFTKEDYHFGLTNADIIQPNLIGLQPSLDDFANMDTMEPFQDLFSEAFNWGTPAATQQSQHIGGSLNNLASFPHTPDVEQDHAPLLFTGPQSTSSSIYSSNVPYVAQTLPLPTETYSHTSTTPQMGTGSNSSHASPMFSLLVETLIEQERNTPANVATANRQPTWHSHSSSVLMPPPDVTGRDVERCALADGRKEQPKSSKPKVAVSKPRPIAPKMAAPSPFLTQLLTKVPQKSSNLNLPTISPKFTKVPGISKGGSLTDSKTIVPDLVAISGSKSRRTSTGSIQKSQSGTCNDAEAASSPSSGEEVFQPPKSSANTTRKDSPSSAMSPAEQKRRGHMKNGFETLQTIVPALANSPTTKISKAAMLSKTAEFAQKLKTERQQMQEESELLQQEIEALNSAIGSCQLQLPATGAPVTSQNNDQMQHMLSSYIRERTTQNWKFYIFSQLAEPLFESFNSVVSTASIEELYRTTHTWLDHHCTLPALRPAVMNSLRNIGKDTSILSEPEKFPEQARNAVIERVGRARSISSSDLPTHDGSNNVHSPS